MASAAGPCARGRSAAPARASRTSAEIIGLCDRLHAAGNTLVVVTHERDIADHAHRVVTIRDGLVASDEPRVRRVTQP